MAHFKKKQVPILCQYSADLTSKQALSILQQLKQKEEGYLKRPRTLEEINNGHRVLLLLLHGGIGKVHGGLFILMKVTMEMKPSIDRTG